jgi:hypothetical protein
MPFRTGTNLINQKESNDFVGKNIYLLVLIVQLMIQEMVKVNKSLLHTFD